MRNTKIQLCVSHEVDKILDLLAEILFCQRYICKPAETSDHHQVRQWRTQSQSLNSRSRPITIPEFNSSLSMSRSENKTAALTYGLLYGRMQRDTTT
jgi:hypothetical protein